MNQRVNQRVNDIGPTEREQTRHRKINTIIGVALSLMLSTSMVWAYNKFEALDAEQVVISEIAQIVADEGYKKCVYKDSRTFPTVGFGHLILPTDDIDKCITPKEAVRLLREDYYSASESVDNRYLWAHGEVRLVLINMTYQMGSTGVSKFKITLEHLQDENYDAAATELLDSTWANQTPSRAARLAGRIMGLN